MKIETTLKAIRAHRPCERGWLKLLAYLGKNKADDEPLPLLTILESNGPADAVWCLRALGPEYHKFIIELTCDFAERALKFVPSGEKRPAKAIAVTRAWLRGGAKIEEVKEAADAAVSAAFGVYSAAAAAARAANYAANAAYAAANTVGAYSAAAYAARAAANAAYAAADAVKAAKADEQRCQAKILRRATAKADETRIGESLAADPNRGLG